MRAGALALLPCLHSYFCTDPRPSTARLYRREIRITAEMVLLRPICSLLQLVHHWLVETQPASLTLKPAGLAYPNRPNQPTNFHAHRQGIKSVSASVCTSAGTLWCRPPARHMPKASPSARLWQRQRVHQRKHPMVLALAGAAHLRDTHTLRRRDKPRCEGTQCPSAGACKEHAHLGPH